MNVATLGGINGMSEVQRDDDVGAVFGFLSRILCMEMHELRRAYRPHYLKQPPKEPGCPRTPGRCRALSL
jgi:hypothetical protein